MSAKQMEILRKAAERRLSALLAYRDSLANLNECVCDARASGVSASAIAEAIGTTRQRVYEILREA